MNPRYPDSSLPPLVIVDDSDDDVFLLRHRLREGGITNPIRAFGSAAEALAFLRDCHGQNDLPAIVFTDIRIPVASGFALISAIRDNSEWRDIRIVVVSSSNCPADLEHALECGANGYLIKFPPSDTLVDFVHNGPWISVPRPAQPLPLASELHV
jgi:CheY-like chemotaxis protein